MPQILIWYDFLEKCKKKFFTKQFQIQNSNKKFQIQGKFKIRQGNAKIMKKFSNFKAPLFFNSFKSTKKNKKNLKICVCFQFWLRIQTKKNFNKKLKKKLPENFYDKFQSLSFDFERKNKFNFD